MSYALSNVTTGDTYKTGTTLSCPATRRLRISVSNAAVFVQRGVGTTGVLWGPEVFTLPADRSLDVVCDAVRVRSGAAGKPAQVTIEALSAEEL